MSKTGTLADRQKIISEHFPYEINMCFGSYEVLKVQQTQFVVNLSIEGFCLHARNLIDFFWDDAPANSKDAVARHFTNTSYLPFDGADPKKDGLYGKINKQIMHLTYDRTDDPTRKIGAEDRRRIRRLIYDEILRFQVQLRSPYVETWDNVHFAWTDD